MPVTKSPILIAPRRGGGSTLRIPRRQIRPTKIGGFNFGHFMSGVGKGILSGAKTVAPIVLPIAIKSLMGAGQPKKRGRPRKTGGAKQLSGVTWKGGRGNPKLIGYY